MSPRETEWARRQRRDRMRKEHIARNGDTCSLCGAGIGTKGLCQSVRTKPLHEDHDHTTQAHRGWLCFRSNRVLWAWVTPAWLVSAAIYLLRKSDPEAEAHLQRALDYLLDLPGAYLSRPIGKGSVKDE